MLPCRPVSERDPMDPSSWREVKDVCGGCIAWRGTPPVDGDEVATGVCRLRSELGRVPASLAKCDLYKRRGEYVYQAAPEPRRKRARASAPRVLRRSSDGEMVVDKSVKAPRAPREPRAPRAPRVRPAPPREVDAGTDELSVVRSLIREVLVEKAPAAKAELHQRFEGGTVSIKAEGFARDFPMEEFFQKLDRFRGALDALEKQIERPDLRPMRNDLMKYLRGGRGSFTTFNVLYQNKKDHFKGQ